MTYEFKLPDIGEGVTEGEIVKWLVGPGDLVREDEPIVEVMTDKATVTITAPKAGKIVETRGKEGTMNRWTGTGHLTKDPKFLETENGTAICTLRIAVKRAGKQGHDGYFDVKCFDAQASACAQYLKAGREIAVDGRLLFDEFQTQDGSYASRIYIVAERVEFLASRKPSNGQASDEASPSQPASGEAREAHQAA